LIFLLSLHNQTSKKKGQSRAGNHLRALHASLDLFEVISILLSAPPSEMVTMATNGNGATAAFTPVLTAMSTMRDGQREQKKAAHQFLESFQKSVSHRNDNLAPSVGRPQGLQFA
jgi:transportin-3